MIKDFIHPTLGQIVVVTNLRSVHLSVRLYNNYLEVTVHPSITQDRLFASLEQIEDKLLKKMERRTPTPTIVLSPGSVIENEFFQFTIALYNEPHFRYRVEKHCLTVHCPQKTEFSSNETQTILKTGLLNGLKFISKHTLPPMVKELASLQNIKVSEVKVNASKGRWGSCNSKRVINLSALLLLLPTHLIRYVILHELTHTFEMNHSERFYKKLNQFCQGDHAKLQQELKAFNTPILQLLRNG